MNFKKTQYINKTECQNVNIERNESQNFLKKLK